MRRYYHKICVLLLVCFSSSFFATYIHAEEDSHAQLAALIEAEANIDRIPPKITAAPLVLSSNEVAVNLLEGVTAIDNVEGDTQIEVMGYSSPTNVAVSSFKPGLQYITYTARDKADNIGYFIRAVYVQVPNSPKHVFDKTLDLTPPEVISAPIYVLANEMTVAQMIAEKENISAYDAHDGDLNYAFQYQEKENQGLDLTQPGQYLIEWRVADQAHNRAVIKQWVIVVDPSELPKLEK